VSRDGCTLSEPAAAPRAPSAPRRYERRVGRVRGHLCESDHPLGPAPSAFCFENLRARSSANGFIFGFFLLVSGEFRNFTGTTSSRVVHPIGTRANHSQTQSTPRLGRALRSWYPCSISWLTRWRGCGGTTRTRSAPLCCSRTASAHACDGVSPAKNNVA
jgi:hypothetical protein